MNQKQIGIGFVILLVVIGLVIFFTTSEEGDLGIPGKSPSPTPADVSSLELTPPEDNNVENSLSQMDAQSGNGQQNMNQGTTTTSKNNKYKSAPAMSIDTNKTYTATIVTNKGTMIAELFAKDAPKTVNNFVFLANDKFYDGLIFHRVIKGFMIQGGDPTGTGTGGPGYKFADEAVTKKYNKGILAMANSGPNTNGSQFFIMHADYPLPPNYTIFGQVTDGLEVIDAIANSPVGANDKPTQPMTIESITIQ
jgi:cyclophilin family peptidyl-prolyl cis-trans isomerase